MHTRREFLNLSVAASLGLAVPARAKTHSVQDQAFGVQLYTVREQLKTDPAGTLAAIRQIGYRSVETFVKQYSMTAKELRIQISDAGLALTSSHFGYEDFGSRLDYAKELGAEYVVCSSVPRPMATSLDGFKRGADQYNSWGEQAKKMGLRFSFHNHNIEFQSFDGVTGIDTLLKNTDPALVQWQMDCYWVAQAGSDPAALIRRYQNRMQTLHVKDRKAGATSSITSNDPHNFVEVGTGTLDWKGIWKAAQAARIPYFFVEQDQTERPPLESLEISYRNLRRLFV